jgi:hypothetical protein
MYLAGALEVGGVGLDEVVGADVLHRQGGGSRRFRHPVAAAGAAVGRGDGGSGVGAAAAHGLGFCGGVPDESDWEFI